MKRAPAAVDGCHAALTWHVACCHGGCHVGMVTRLLVLFRCLLFAMNIVIISDIDELLEVLYQSRMAQLNRLVRKHKYCLLRNLLLHALIANDR